MNPKPKPAKGGKKREMEARKHTLSVFRRVNAARAIERDNGQCVICYYNHGVEQRYDDVHHVYGRGREAGDDREHYTSLMCVCRGCHPMPIQTPGANASLYWVEHTLILANNDPINRAFQK